jgi:fumarate reductase subunit C
MRSRQQAATGSTAREYIRPMPTNWWLEKKAYLWFMIRELTSLFVGGYALFLLVLASRRGDPEAFAAMLDCTFLTVLQIIALPMVLYHTITWFNLTPKALVIWRGEEKVCPILIAGANYVAWVVVSIIILFIVSRYR